MKFRKKPVVIEAVQWRGDNTDEITNFVTEGVYVFDSANNLYINTLEGQHKANINDWIIKGVKGEFYPCKPDIFEMTYEKVE